VLCDHPILGIGDTVTYPEPADPAGPGRHRDNRPGAVSVAEFLRHAITNGDPVRLAWPHPDKPAALGEDCPTAELPTLTMNTPWTT
jgi:hypothetical protein